MSNIANYGIYNSYDILDCTQLNPYNHDDNVTWIHISGNTETTSNALWFSNDGWNLTDNKSYFSKSAGYNSEEYIVVDDNFNPIRAFFYNSGMH